jgi:hypothetical protein
MGSARRRRVIYSEQPVEKVVVGPVSGQNKLKKLCKYCKIEFLIAVIEYRIGNSEVFQQSGPY